MSGEYKLSFGKHEGQTFDMLKHSDPGYIMWLSGYKTKHSFNTENIKIYAAIMESHSDAVQAAKEFLKNKCTKCWSRHEAGHFCKGMQNTRNYHFHPYGKRDF